MRLAYGVLGVLALVVFLAWQFPYAISGTEDKMQLLYSVTLLLMVGGGIAARRHFATSETLKYAAIWLVIILGIVLGYSYKNAILDSRLGAELVPNRPRLNGDGSVSITAREDGHFYIEAKVNGQPVEFLIDTGATDVTLSTADAKRIGLNPEALKYTRSYRTANGVTGGAPITLKRLAIGPFTLDNFAASVNQGQLDNSLLGMSALNALGGFRIEGRTLLIGNTP